MTPLHSNRSASPAQLRLWPGIAAAVLLLMLRLVVPLLISDSMLAGLIAAIGPVIAALAIIVWWVFFSRAAWLERLGAVVLMIATLAVTSRLVHESIAGAGMGALFYIWALPLQALALVTWAVAARGLSRGARRACLVVAILLVTGVFTTVRTAGITSDLIGSEFHWRWTPTPEEQLLAQSVDDTRNPASDRPASSSPSAVTEAPGGAPALEGAGDAAALGSIAESAAKTPVLATAADAAIDWPGFRGGSRDSIVRGSVPLETNWSQNAPVEMWRRPIGPGWSSFAVRGDLIYTQEQRGDDEIVTCYRLSTGEPVWRHQDGVRFWESNGGAGPRATPTLSLGRVFALGATGILNALDAGNGTVVWSRNTASDTGTPIPTWGFSSSPLVIDDSVVVSVAGTMAAYDVASGKPRWTGPRHNSDSNYSSPQLVTIDGVPQIVLIGSTGVTSVAPDNGALLWEYEWAMGGGAIVQPALLEGGDLLVSGLAATGGGGIRRLAIAREDGAWRTNERWISTGLKPYFNDFVVHHGHAYGFDGNILASIELATGARRWKGGRYGNGQMMLLSDQDLLLVTTEEGEVALVRATPDQFTELARVPALEGKTWNHPVMVGDVLLMRNGQEMAAFRLPRASR